MYLNVKSHSLSQGISSFGLIEYLEKENEIQEETDKMSDDKKEEVKDANEYFFDNNFDENNSEQKIKKDEVTRKIDNNKSSKRSIKEANFYMLNVAPSKKEQEHMENIAEEELKKRGLINNKENEKIYKEQKDQLMKMQMKFYVKDLMKEYAENFNREIPVDESKLPKGKDKKEILKETEERFNMMLKAKGIDVETKKPKERDKEWIEVDNLKIKGEKGNSYLVNVSLNDNLNADVYMPKKMVYEQVDDKFKIPKNLYEEKHKEVVNKLTDVSIGQNGYVKGEDKTLKNGDKVLNFSKEDERFNNDLKISFNEKDVKIVNGEYLVSKHLYEQRIKKAQERAIEETYGNQKEEMYKDVAKEKGFNADTRKVTVDDIMWYGKIETQRTYKHSEKVVMQNKVILKQIEDLKKDNSKKVSKEIKELETKLKCNERGEVIKEGMKKDGNQYHAHIVVSRHDKTMKDKDNKISLSPFANQKDSKMPNGKQVGFDRDNFYQKAETIFDEKFSYDRKENEKYKNYKSKSKANEIVNAGKSTGNYIGSKVKGEVKQFIYKNTGLAQIKSELSPISKIKSQIGVSSIPTSLPKSPVEMAYKGVKKIIDKGLGY